jgi:hypothetical protein
MPLLWLILAAGAGVGATLIAKRVSDSSVTMLPGQVWTIVVSVHPTKPWTDISKGSVAIAIRAALTGIGAIPIDGFWSGDYQFIVAASSIAATQIKIGTVLTLLSEWANQGVITNINQAPAAVPVMIPRFP